MKALKVSIILLICTGFACAMDNGQASSSAGEPTAAAHPVKEYCCITDFDTEGKILRVIFTPEEEVDAHAGSSADETTAAAPLFEHNVSVITVDTKGVTQEIIFAPRQIARINAWRDALKKLSPAACTIIDLRIICVNAPYLRSEILKYVPDLVSLQDRTAFEHYLGKLTPEELCFLVCALGYLDVPQAFAWAHAYFVNQLMNNRKFFEQNLSNIENLRKIMQLAQTKHLPESLNLLKTIRLKNNLMATGHLTGYEPTLSRDGSLLSIGDRQDSYYPGMKTVYRTIDGKCVRSMLYGNSCNFTEDGSLLAVSDEKPQITLYHSHNSVPAWPTISGIFLGYSPDGTLLATTLCEGRQDTLYLYRTDDLTKPLARAKAQGRNPIMVFNPDNSLVVVICDGEAVSLYHVNDLTKPILATNGHYAEFSSRGQLAISTYYGCNIVLYDTNDPTRAIGTVDGYEGIFSTDGSLLAATLSRDDKIKIYRTSDLTQCIVTLTGNRCLFSPDGKLLAVGQVDEKRNPKDVKLYDTRNWAQIGNSMPGALPRSCKFLQAAKRAFSPDGSFLVLSMEGDFYYCGNIYCTHDGSLLTGQKGLAQVGSTDFDCVVAYHSNYSEKPDDIEFKRTLTMTTDEYLLTFAAIHQGADIDEAFWRTIFDHVQPQVKKFVQEKTGKFIS